VIIGYNKFKFLIPCEVKAMLKYVLKYWFEHGGNCLWSMNDEARIKFGYAINNEELPISKALVDELYALETEYHGYLDWEYPPSLSPWTLMQKDDFKSRANELYHRLRLELGSDFEIINEIDSCVE
jgi:hypothetical protein